MNDSDFLEAVDLAGNFELRQAVERLRAGLFDPLSVRLLTVGEARLSRIFEQGAEALDKNMPAYLCICGPYGQGKSHSLTYIRQEALRQGFVTSHINLDPRETPFHDFQQVYRALVAHIRFPDMETSLVNRLESWANPPDYYGRPEGNEGLEDRFPDILSDEIPHLFKCVLTALARDTVPLSRRERQLKKHAAFHPDEFPYLLARALKGEAVPVHSLRPAFRYRKVFFYKDASLRCRGWEPYLGMLFGLGRLFQKMGFKGWVALFDEAESIAQIRVDSRKKSYQILHRIFAPETPVAGFYPVFAFTDDFFLQVQHEDYDRIKMVKGTETPYFEKNYADLWRDMDIYRLRELSSKEWIDLSVKLMVVHAKAYGWEPSERETCEEMMLRLSETRDQEARMKLKALVDQLDLVQQRQILGEPDVQE